MRILIKFFSGLAIFVLLLGAIYLIGPRVDTPDLDLTPVTIDVPLEELESWIEQKETAIGNVR
ncbi:MAG: hypothetical protein ACO3M3_06575, partial [Flavobacteriaceae bacterium]